MKKILLLLALVAIYTSLFVSCDTTNIGMSDFIGEYEMTTEVITVYGDAEFDDNPTVTSNVTIYQEQGKLFVQTDCFGMPFACVEDSTNTSVIVIMNGLVRTIVHGILAESLPIPVKNVTFNQLSMNNSKPFEITIVDITGERMTTIDFHFEYKPIFKQNETLAWELSLIPHQPIDEGAVEMTAIKYKNILRKK